MITVGKQYNINTRFNKSNSRAEWNDQRFKNGNRDFKEKGQNMSWVINLSVVSRKKNRGKLR